LAGSAVWRSRGGYLQHGSILLHDTQLTLERFRLPRVDSVERVERVERMDLGASVTGPRSAQVSDWLPPACDATVRARVNGALAESWRAADQSWEEFRPSA